MLLDTSNVDTESFKWIVCFNDEPSEPVRIGESEKAIKDDHSTRQREEGKRLSE